MSESYGLSTWDLLREGEPPAFNIDNQYPTQVFTLMILGANQDKFGKLEDEYKNKRIVVTGKIPPSVDCQRLKSSMRDRQFSKAEC